MNHIEEFFMLAKLNLLFAIGHLAELTKEIRNVAGNVDPDIMELYNAFIQMVSTCEKIMDALDSPSLNFNQKAAEKYAYEHTIFETFSDFLSAIYRYKEWFQNVISQKDIKALGEISRYILFIELGQAFSQKSAETNHTI
ncbi:MAG: hypothetical protein J7L94_00025 [Caldisericaceae bacterium]|nr:hypothetical protein [Caldisericaceae bacterium]